MPPTDTPGETKPAGGQARGRDAVFREGDHQTRSFEDVLAAEIQDILRGRALRVETPEVAPPAGTDVPNQADADGLVSLALSGPGVRAATFHLGVLQGLARAGVLRRLDYLSLASGGGYIGGWLTAWIQRAGLATVVDELAGRRAQAACPDRPVEDSYILSSGPVLETGSLSPEAPEVEAAAVRFLRRFSDYLEPRRGLLSAETWVGFVTSARNFILNFTVLVLMLGVILLSPRLLLLLSRAFSVFPPAELVLLAAMFLNFAIFWLGINLAQVPHPDPRGWPWFARQGWVQILVVVPLFSSTWFATLWLWSSNAGALGDRSPADLSLARWLGEMVPAYAASGLAESSLEVVAWAVLAAILYQGLWLVAGTLSTLIVRGGEEQRWGQVYGVRTWATVLLAAPFAGAVGGAVLWALTLLANSFERQLSSIGLMGSWNLVHLNVWMPPAMVAALGITTFAHAALIGRGLPDSVRHWWIRFGAWLLVYALLWLLVFGGAFYGPIVLILLLATKQGTSLLGTGWLVSTATGLLVGRMAPGGDEKARAWVRAIARAAPWLFAVGLLGGTILGLHAILGPAREPAGASATSAKIPNSAEPLTAERREYGPVCDYFFAPREEGSETSPAEIFQCHIRRLWEGTTLRGTLGLVGAMGFLALLLGSRVDINEFSQCFSLRDRLIRVFLAASHLERRPHPSTGFDLNDDVPLAELSAERGYDGPYPIYAAALHLVAGKELAWQDRKAASFVFSPLASGFDVYAGEGTGSLEPFGYRPTPGYDQSPEGLSSGTAMAISGAEPSPGESAEAASSMALFLTVFNSQAGWWLGNPRHRRTWSRTRPHFGIMAPLSRAFGFLDEESRYVYLRGARDFEGLGLYELVRRRCSVVLVSDGSVDPRLSMLALGRAIRMCRTDFGVDIEIDISDIHGDPETGMSVAHFAVGSIRYDSVDPRAAPGTLIYWKPSLTGDEPVGIAAHHKANPAFPHESSRDQRFSEDQFESYRSLGEHIALSVFGGK